MTQFPFTAIVGMEQAKESLIFHAIDPRIGGTLFLGHRGCAKSTLVRAFAEIMEKVSDGGAPFVEVPLGATEDRLLGSVNAEALIERGKWHGRAGLIEEAHGGILYIDEVNLLPDHLADFILDSAASGRYRMERDGITRVVESRYILVGTMNPEEGDLRPQLSDRFAHGVRVHDRFTPDERMEIVQRRIQFDDDPEIFIAHWATSMIDLVDRIRRARTNLASIQISHEHRRAVAARGESLKLEGVRAELAVVRTARCAAAWRGSSEVEDRDVEVAWELCLGHRQPEPPQPEHTPPDAGNSRMSSSGPATSGHTSQAPRDALPSTREIRPFRMSLDEKLSQWWRRHQFAEATASPTVGGSCGFTESGKGPIAWIESLKYSFMKGGFVAGGRLSLRRRRVAQNKTVWCFLDASRSTGASQFLGSARDTLVTFAERAKSARFHLLVLADGAISWWARKATASRFKITLQQLNRASGKSLIIDALKILHRARLRKSAASGDRVIIASDGLASPLKGERSEDTLSRLRGILQRSTRTLAPFAWLHPEPKRGLGKWLPRVSAGLPVDRLECPNEN